MAAPHSKLVEELRRTEGMEQGELEAIAAVEQLGAEALLVDDQRAVVAARARGIQVVRTPALYVAA